MQEHFGVIVMALALADLLGTPADGTDLDRNIEIGKKATGASSAVAAGRAVFLTASTGVWAITTSTSIGKRQGIIPKLHPLNVDADDTLQVATGQGSQWYVEAAGAIKPGQPCTGTTSGKVVGVDQFDTTATPTETTIEAAIAAAEAPFIYVGHYGEGSGLYNDPTDAANADPIRVEIRK
jgi:hypothetical protein